jgi:hypothetical protein
MSRREGGDYLDGLWSGKKKRLMPMLRNREEDSGAGRGYDPNKIELEELSNSRMDSGNRQNTNAQVSAGGM